jgi:hypothetical protein
VARGASGGDTIDVAELECALREADAAALLVPPRILRRVIKRDRGLTFLGWHAARRKTYVIAAEPLRAIVAEDELVLWPESEWPPVAILLVRPEPKALASRPADAVLLEYWRMLFHARVELAVRRAVAGGRLDAAALRERIERIGPTAFEEIRSVLRQEGHLLPPRDNATVYAEFAALFLELEAFAPELTPHFFPAIEGPREVVGLLAADVDATSLLAETRLAGAAEPGPAKPPGTETEEMLAALSAQPPRRGARAARRLFGWLIVNAERAADRGNLVRAAIDRARAGLLVGPVLAVQATVGAHNELDRLVGRLQAALGFEDREAEAWRQALPPLLDRAIHGFWTPEGRLLYDLQTVCLDHEREVFTVDVVEWARSFGRLPIRRTLPHLHDVLMSSHLRGAARRLRAARLRSGERAKLAELLHPAVRRAEEAVRSRFRPLIDGVFRSTGILPHNLPETVAYHKLIEELLDRIVHRGFLSLGDLRDACSRSNLKLPDLSGPAEFFRGDRLLRTDVALGRALDGVYRRGEVYLRGLQRLSTLAFATRTGRFLTLYAVLPFGGAFVILEGLQHLVGPVVHWLTHRHVHLMHPAAALYLGAVAMGLINSPAYRRHFLEALGRIGHGLRLLLVDLPARVLQHRVIRQVLDSRLALALWRFLIKPLACAAPVGLLGVGAGLPQSEVLPALAVVFLSAMVVLNTRMGRDAEEIVADSLVRIWRQLYVDVIPGVFRLILTTFDRVLEGIERLLYAVDEWLRFRSGQRRSALLAKAVLGLGWFFVAYLVRIYVNLLIEPQVNPIKHFPVVTVSHKVILPLSVHLTKLLAAPLMPLGKGLALFIAGTTVLLLPGVFGFLVWELKENWRLYEANRAENLAPVTVGGHGETMGRLLRPGIHSGTLPKLYAKLRGSERRPVDNRDDKRAYRRLEALHHVEESIRRFVDRDFITLLAESRTLRAAAITAGELRLATNRVRIELRSALTEDSEEGPWLEFDERHHALIAGIEGPGWLDRLDEEQARVLGVAVVGLFKMCGVEWIRARPDTRSHAGRIVPELAGVAEGPASPIAYGPPGAELPADHAETPVTTLIPFRTVSVTWKRWVEAWQREQAGAKHPTRFLEGYTIFPRERPGRKPT